MKNRNMRRIVILAVMMCAVLMMCCGCRHRITDDVNANMAIEDYDGIIQEEYEMRRDELGLEKTKKSWFAGDRQEEPDIEDEYYEDFEYEDEDFEEDDYYEEEFDDEEDEGDGTTVPAPVHRTPVVRPVTPTPVRPTPQVAVKVNVTLDANGGKVSNNKLVVTYNSKYGTLPAPTRDDYTFQGWYTAKDGGSKIGSDTTVANKSDHTLYAHWKKKAGKKPEEPSKPEKPDPDKEYKITYDLNGGEGSLDGAVIRTGDKFTEMPEPEREGYIFMGWYTKPEGGGKIENGTEFSGTSDVTLYAHWKDEKENTREYWESEFSSAAEGIKDEDRYTCYLEKGNEDQSGLIEECRGNIVGEIPEGDKAPDFVIRFTDDMGKAEETAEEIAERYPDSRILIIPEESLKTENDNQKLFYRILVLYSMYGDADSEDYLKQAAEQLETEGTIYQKQQS